jgi:hypothetical protein
MAKAKKAAPAKSQAQRLLEVTRKARSGAGGSGGNAFARDVGKTTLTRQGRKPVKMG